MANPEHATMKNNPSVISVISVRDQAPPWFPENPAPFKFRGRFSAAERKILRKRRRIRVSKWAQRHRVITMGKYKGSWQNKVTPYLAGIMDSMAFQSIRTVILCAAPQIGKTEAVNNFIGYCIDRAPGPVLYVYPDALTARENSKDRILPMIESSPRLKSYMTGWEDDKTSLRIKLAHMPIYLAWAGSAARLANKPIRYVIFDETDKYPPVANKREADPISLGEKRTITYRYDHKIIKLSTPTTESGPVWQALTTEAEAIFDYHVPCWACGELQPMVFEQIQWPKEVDEKGGESHPEPERMQKEALARYVCVHCQAEWADHDRDRAVSKGIWRARDTGQDINRYLKTERPRKIGFHLPSWVSPFISMSAVAAAFIKTLIGGLAMLKDFRNAHQAWPWKQITMSASESGILAARCDLPPQKVPEEAVALTAGIDVQLRGFWFAVRAWALDYTSWLIHYGFLPLWADVETLLFETTYPKEGSETRLRIFRAAIDTGGGKTGSGISMTEETYWWLRKNQRGRRCRVWGTKGSSRALAGKLNIGKPLERTPSGKPLPGGIRIISVDTMQVKDAYHYHLQRAVDDLAQGAYLHADTGVDYANHILAEEKEIDDRGNEKWVQKRADNHLFDCECLAMLCADPEWPGGGIHLLSQADRPRPKRRVISNGIEN